MKSGACLSVEGGGGLSSSAPEVVGCFLEVLGVEQRPADPLDQLACEVVAVQVVAVDALAQGQGPGRSPGAACTMIWGMVGLLSVD